MYKIVFFVFWLEVCVGKNVVKGYHKEQNDNMLNLLLESISLSEMQKTFSSIILFYLRYSFLLKPDAITNNKVTLIGSQADYEMMTAALYGEGSKNLEEMQAIGDVIMNRADIMGTNMATEITAPYQVDGYNDDSRKVTSNNRTANKNSKLNTARQAAMTTMLGTSRGKSNGAYYWDGSDIKTNEHNTKWGIHYTNKAHDIYNTGDSLVGPYQEFWKPSGKNRGDPWNHKLDSTAAYGGTIF